MRKFFSKIKPLLKPLLLCAFCTLPLLLIYLFHIVSSYSYDNDFGRDLVDILSITNGDLTLLGPKLSFGGLHTGPYYYYLFAPILFFFPGQPESLLYANAVLAWIALVLLGTMWHKLEKWTLLYTLLAVYWIGLSSYFVYSARGPGNAFSYIPWLVFLSGMYPQIWKRSSWWLWGLYGLFWGIVVNFHLAVGFIALPLLLILAGSVLMKRSVNGWQRLWRPLALAGGFAAAFAPLILFEVTHNFVMIRNTFIDQSYKAFTNNTNLINPLRTSTNPIENFWLFISQAGSWLIPSLVVILVLIVLYVAVHRKKIAISVWAMVVSLLVSLSCVALAATSQLAFHYFYPFIVLTQIVYIWLMSKEKFGAWLLGVAVCLSIIYFPRAWYVAATRPIHAFREIVEQITQSTLNTELANSTFSVYVTRETPLAPIGSEYRYFLATHGLSSLPASAYGQAERLLWIAEQPLDNLDGVKSWELDQFGPRELLDQQQIGTRTVYLFGHQSVQ